ncbi:MAG: PAS domain S-box protein [Burkholderiales bacterium]|nr:PAS domain S-box protein [Burkholderiales bacterium]
MANLVSPRRAAFLVFGLGLVLTAVAVAWLSRYHSTLIEQRFADLSEATAENIVARMQKYELGVRGAGGAVVMAGPDRVTWSGFQNYAGARNFDREFPGARGFGFVRRVAAADEAAFVAAARRDGKPDFSVRQLTPHNGERNVIQYAAPLERNAQAIGLDIASEPRRWAAAERSMHSGVAVLSAPITLVQAIGKSKQSFLLMHPTYRPGMPLTTPVQREAAAFGWTYAALVTDEILGAGGNRSAEYGVVLRDLSEDGGTEPFFVSLNAELARLPGLVQRNEIRIFGRVWEAEFTATPQFVAGLNLIDPRIIVAGGVLLALLAALLALSNAENAARAAAIRIAQAHHAAIVDASSDAIIGTSIEGRIVSWNPAAQRIFGHAPAEMLGLRLDALAPGHNPVPCDAGLALRVGRGETIDPFDAVRLRRDGSEVDVSITAYPLTNDTGDVVGMGLTIRDISDRKSVERRMLQITDELERKVVERTTGLEEARRDLRTILDALPSKIGYLDRNRCNRFSNLAYQSWAGIDADQLMGLPMREVLDEDLYARSLPYAEAALRGEPQTFESRFPAADGQRGLHLLTHYLPDVVDGEVRGFYVLMHDVTELEESRQRAASALRETEMLLGMVHQHAIVSEADCSGRITDANDAFCRMSGYRRDELLGLSHSVVKSEVHGVAFWDELWQTIASGRAWRGEICNRAKDGSLYWVDSIIAPFVGDDGRVKKYISIRFDITDRKRAELELQNTASMLRIVLEAPTEVGIIAVDPEGLVTIFNTGAERLLGYSQAEATGRLRALDFHDPEELHQRAAQLSAETGRRVGRRMSLVDPSALNRPHEWTYLRKDAGRVSVSLTVTALHNEQGECFGYLGVAHDVTRQKQYEASLHEAVRLAEQANQAKSQFLANMSHEIRTPMNGVIGLTYLLGQTTLDAQQTDFLDKIKLTSKSLLGVINDVLDISKIEAGELTVACDPFCPRELLTCLADVMRLQTNDKHIELVLELPALLPPALLGDAMRLNQILTNLLSNAIKFTQVGNVRLIVLDLDAEGPRTTLRFEVHDTGIGISPQDARHLFQPFSQADASITRRFGGTGLGLSIVKRLVEMMGGRVGLESTPGRGSQFWVELSFDPSEAVVVPGPVASPTDADGPALAGVRVLVVDDNQINLQVARRILTLHGAQISLATNGQEAVDLLRLRPDDFDVVLMDIHMPVLDGLSATRLIRKEPALGQLPVIALTAGALSSQRDDAIAAGMNDFVMKPFEPPALIACIDRHVRASNTAVRRPQAPASTIDPTSTADWPELEGIETVDARRLLVGDLALFRELVTHLLNEYDPLPVPDLTADTDALLALSRTLHKLRGGAGSLGAKGIHALAREAEIACGLGDRDRAQQLIHELNAQLQRLRHSAGDWLAARTTVPANAKLAQGAPVPPAALARLMGLLEQQNLDAIEQFDALAAGLQHTLGRERFERARAHVENLRFGHAASELADAAH